jgi:excisionase family DNA binding protein
MIANEHELKLPKLLLTTREVAELLGAGERSVWRWSRSGAMPAPVRINGAVRFRRSEVEEWIVGGCLATNGRAN